MGAKLLREPTRYFSRDEFTLFDDFVQFTDAQLWTVAVAATGTAAHEGPGRSNFRLFGTADNDPAVLATTHELFKFVAGKSLLGECLLKFEDVNTDDGAIAFGFADAMAATLIADGGASIVIPNDGAIIFKLKDTTTWRFQTEIGTSATVSISDTPAASSGFQQLRIDIQPRNATTFRAVPFVDGVQLKTSTGQLIAHDIVLGTATDMDFGLVQKSGHANDLATLVDYVFASQLR